MDYMESKDLSLLSIGYNNNQVWKMWLVDLEKLSYSAEDLFDEISLDLSQVIAGNESHQVRNRLQSSFKKCPMK